MGPATQHRGVPECLKEFAKFKLAPCLLNPSKRSPTNRACVPVVDEKIYLEPSALNPDFMALYPNGPVS